MSRLDRHVGRVQNKLAMSLFLTALGTTVAVLCGLLVVGVVVNRLAHLNVPERWAWPAAGLGVAALVALGYAVFRRPSAHQAAVAIDGRLGLAEKFSTALYARRAGTGNDPFAAAAVLDAERTADNVSLNRQFPLPVPTTAYWAGTAVVAFLVAAWLVPTLDLFGRDARRQASAAKAREVAANREVVQQAIAKVSAFPKSVQDAPQVQLAKAEAQRALDQNNIDHVQATDSAMKLLQESTTAGLEEVKQNQKFAEASTNQQLFNTLNPSADDKGPVADATRDMAKGNFAGAMDQLQSLPQKFNDMTPAEQKKAADQAAKLANQLAKMANNPAAMKQLQQQVQQMGASQQQAQQLAQAVQQAAQGNPQAQQQLQQMQKQMMQQMNGGQGPTPQQQQQIQQAVQQMQAAANTQQTAQQMSAAAQQMASAMQQQAAAGQPKAGAQGQQAAQGSKAGGQQMAAAQHGAGQQAGQQAGQKAGGGQQKAGGQQQANGQQQGGQQPGGQQPGGQQPGQQASGNQAGGNQAGGNQPGGQQPGVAPGQQGQQNMAQAQQQMQDALAQMDAVQKDAQQMAAAENGAGDAPGQGAGQGQGPGQRPGGGGAGQGNGPKNNQHGNGQGAGGVGGVQGKAFAQYTVKQSIDPSQQIANGRMLAKTFVKAPQDKGTSTIQFTPAAAAAVKDATDDVPEESVPKDAQSSVKKYFETMDNPN